MVNARISSSRGPAIAVVATALVMLLGGCGSGNDKKPTPEANAGPTSSAPAGFTALETQRCPTGLGKKIPGVQIEATMQVAVPASSVDRLVAYQDAAGTALIGPKGWKCEAGIGSDDSERINVFPPGRSDPGEPPFKPGEVVSLQLYTTCTRCIAEYVCPLFPTAKPVKRYGTAGGPQCPAKGLREQVTRPSPSTALFFDPPHSDATGTGSGGVVPTLGAMSYTEATGMRKVSCTLGASLGDLCPGIVGATMLAAPL